MSTIVKKLLSLERKWFLIIAAALLLIMTVNRLLLSDVYYLISSVLMGACGAGLYFTLVRSKRTPRQ